MLTEFYSINHLIIIIIIMMMVMMMMMMMIMIMMMIIIIIMGYAAAPRVAFIVYGIRMFLLLQ